MKLAIFNGSPRKSKSNSTLLMSHFIKGYSHHETYDDVIHYLADVKKTAEHIEKFIEAELAIFIFPLYTDAMPGQVKYFFEELERIDSKGKNVAFIIQSGFPEAYHSIFVERYLIKLAKRMEWNNCGNLIKGGVEGIQIMPERMNKKLFQQFEQLGFYMKMNGNFSPAIVSALRKPYRMGSFRLFLFRFIMLFGLENYYWNMKLRENNAYENRFATPYAPMK